MGSSPVATNMNDAEQYREWLWSAWKYTYRNPKWAIMGKLLLEELLRVGVNDWRRKIYDNL